jgi:hypothetical protein
MRAVAMVLAALLASSAHADPISRIEGVYKDRHDVVAFGEPNGYVSTEDVVEIVRYDDAHVYLRARLWFYNGQVCGISGIAAREADGFVFRDPEDLMTGGQCTLRVASVGDRLMLTDRVGGESTCRAYCGVNGSLASYTIPMSRRMPIRYLDRLKSSRQYLKAIQDLQKSNLQRSDPGTTPEEVQRRHQE